MSPACQGSRFLYFSPLTSLKLFRVRTAALNSQEDISGSVEELGRKARQSDGLAMDNRGNLYMPVYQSCISGDGVRRRYLVGGHGEQCQGVESRRGLAPPGPAAG